MKLFGYFSAFIFIVAVQFSAYFIQEVSATNNQRHSGKSTPKPIVRRLAPCQACRALVQSFEKGVQRTADNKDNQGWGETGNRNEAKKETSEYSDARFLEIKRDLCSEVSLGKDQCRDLLNENERLILEWWNTKHDESEDMLDWLCILKLQVCCPENHFGPNCFPCLGFPGDICSGHGKCKGNGTRKGNGECSCDTGYSGKTCNNCAPSYYEAYKDKNKLLCSACHKACHGGCSGAGAKNCLACKDGWETDDEKGCIDLNECLLELEPCKQNEFCVNAEGSYKCIECDRSCDSCFGDGPDMCEQCAAGFFLQDKICVDGSTAERNFQISTTRYLTYFGLCVATCIIFQKNIAIASIIGLAVAIYITASEYLLSKSQY